MLQVAYEIRRLLAQCVANIRFHRVRIVATEWGDIVIKRRTLVGTLMVPAANWYLRFLDAGVAILKRGDWLRREERIRNLSDVDDTVAPLASLPSASRICLVTKRLAGTTLSELLRNNTRSYELKLHLLKAALRSLAQLHSRMILWGDGESRPLSHGDATVHNVIVAPQSSRAQWLDFETSHDPRMATMNRQADDIRALLFSAAAYIPAQYLTQFTAVLEAYPHLPVVEQLRQRLKTNWSRPNVFQLAQAPLTYQQHQRLMAALIPNSQSRQPTT